jgi:hypothetical protein
MNNQKHSCLEVARCWRVEVWVGLERRWESVHPHELAVLKQDHLGHTRRTKGLVESIHIFYDGLFCQEYQVPGCCADAFADEDSPAPLHESKTKRQVESRWESRSRRNRA